MNMTMNRNYIKWEAINDSKKIVSRDNKDKVRFTVFKKKDKLLGRVLIGLNVARELHLIDDNDIVQQKKAEIEIERYLNLRSIMVRFTQNAKAKISYWPGAISYAVVLTLSTETLESLNIPERLGIHDVEFEITDNRSLLLKIKGKFKLDKMHNL